jgi:hypothetical protein
MNSYQTFVSLAARLGILIKVVQSSWEGGRHNNLASGLNGNQVKKVHTLVKKVHEVVGVVQRTESTLAREMVELGLAVIG